MSRKLTVLVADDDASMRSMLALMLDNLFELDVVGTAAEAEGLMRSKNYDLLVLDVHLPDDTGLNLYKTLYKNRESDGPALMVISADDKNDMIICMNKS